MTVTVALREIDDWRESLIPGSDRPAQLRVLHADPATGASVCAVRFPPAWSRPASGHYTAAEEFVVLEGSLRMGGELSAGDYAFVPPRFMREPTFSAEGAFVVAWFAGPPVWVESPPAIPAAGELIAPRPGGVVREASAEVPGTFEVHTTTPGPFSADADVLDPASWQWEWVPAGASTNLVGPRLYARTWH